MKQTNHGIKISIMIMIIIQACSISIGASSRAIMARVATQYVPSIVTSVNNSDTSNFAPKIDTPAQFNKNSISSKINRKIPQANLALVKNDTQSIEQSRSLRALVDELLLLQEVDLPTNDEYHIDTEFLTDENIASFKNKFDDETDLFITKLSDYWTLVKDRYDELKNSDHSLATVKEKDAALPASQNKARTMSREEAILAIIKTTEKVFDPNDKRSLSAYIREMKQLTESLDPSDAADKNIIDAIDFLQKNQHRTNILWDAPFWRDAIKTKNLKAIPYSSKIKEIPKDTLLTEFNKKLNFKDEI